MNETDLERYPPTGDRRTWILYGPAGPNGNADNFRGKRVAEHEHTAANPGDDCDGCGFPWWP